MADSTTSILKSPWAWLFASAGVVAMLPGKASPFAGPTLMAWIAAGLVLVLPSLILHAAGFAPLRLRAVCALAVAGFVAWIGALALLGIEYPNFQAPRNILSFAGAMVLAWRPITVPFQQGAAGRRDPDWGADRW